MNIKNKIKNLLPQTLVTKYKKRLLTNGIDNKKVSEPKYYNVNGELIRTFYLCDVNCGLDQSLTADQQSQYIQWDRSRYTLPIHFYTDDMIWTQMGKPRKKFAILLEPKSLQAGKYRAILNNPGILKDYEALFTYSRELLDSIPNALPYITGGVYIGTKSGGGQINDHQYEKKTKNISLVSSEKRTCELHRIRFDLAKRYDQSDLVDCFGSFKGERIKIWDSLGQYRYSIVIENEIDDYWITERICNCFASMTVPIYLGSPKIGEFFNSAGIISFSKQDIVNFDEILKKCNEKDYMNRLSAIKDNFERVKEYRCKEDWIYTHYKYLFEDSEVKL